MSDAPKAFAFLHRMNVKSFGTGRKAWFPAARHGTTYTVPVEAVEAPLTTRNVEDSGLVMLPDDALVLHMTRDQCPYEPRPDDLFTFGKDAGGRKYRVVTCTGAEDRYPHFRVVAQRQQ